MSVFIDALKDKGIKYEPAEVPTLEEAQSKKIGFGTFLEESPTLQTTAEKPIDEIGEYSAKDLITLMINCQLLFFNIPKAKLLF